MANEWATVTCSQEPTVTKNEDGTFNVRIYDPNKTDLLEFLNEYDVVCHFGDEKLVAWLDQDVCKKHFHLYDDDGSHDIERLHKEVDRLKNELAEKEKEIQKLKPRDYLQYEEIPKK